MHVVVQSCSPPGCRPLTDRWMAQCVAGRWFTGILFLLLCSWCYVIAGVLFPVSVCRLAAPCCRHVPDETVSRYLPRVQAGLNGQHVGLIRGWNGRTIRSRLSSTFYFSVWLFRDAGDDLIHLSGRASSRRWVWLNVSVWAAVNGLKLLNFSHNTGLLVFEVWRWWFCMWLSNHWI